MTPTGTRAPRPRSLFVVGALLTTTGVAWTVTRAGPSPDTVASALVRATPILATIAVLASWRHVVRLRRDRDAHERLQLLVDRTCVPDVHLLAVLASVWTTAAGQVADTVDVATGTSRRVWFPLACLPMGAFVLVQSQLDQVQMLDWMPPAEVKAAHRRRASRQQQGVLAGRRSRRGRRQLVAEVEHALRRAGGTGPVEPSRPLRTPSQFDTRPDRRRA